MEYLKADIKDVVVFGDGENDLVMFKKEWTSIAMGNGVEDLKKKQILSQKILQMMV